MANPNDAQKPGKKMDAASAQKMREELASRVSELSDDELSEVAGGTTPAVIAVTTATLAMTTYALPIVDGPSNSPGYVPSPGASTI